MKFDVSKIRKQFPALSAEVCGWNLHYLDNAATSQMPINVIDAVMRHEITARGNVQRGAHHLAERATQAYEGARASVARFLNAASASEVVFTSGTTAAINLLAHSLGSTLGPGDEIVITAAEHHSNYVPWLMLQKRVGVRIRILPVTAEGELDLNQLSSLVSDRCKLIALTQCSNVTGAETDVAPVVKVAREVGAQVLLDGAQMVPHGPVDVQALGVDYYVFSAHKCFAPNGVGVLWIRSCDSRSLSPFMGGGGMVSAVSDDQVVYAQGNSMFEAGTPAIAQAVGLGKALDWMMDLRWSEIRQHEQQLLQLMLDGLSDIRGLSILGPAEVEKKLPVVSFAVKDAHPHDICHLLNERGVALRGGHHCAQPLLDALGVSSVSRASLALYNNEEDVLALIDGVARAVRILR
ncbi:MAG: cysteine desulfurase [Amphritea sp.]